MYKFAAFCIIILELIALPMISFAAPIVITFEEPVISSEMVETRLAYQYADMGITFNAPKVIDYSRSSSPERFQNFAHSGTKAIEQCRGEEFCMTPIQIKFSDPQKRVKVWVGYSDSLSNKKSVVMRAFDQSGAKIKEAAIDFQPSNNPISIKTPMEIVSDIANIDSVTLNLVAPAGSVTSNNRLAIDDIEFDSSGPGSCSATNNPVVTISQPISGQILRSNLFDAEGIISTETELYDAKLIIDGSGGSKSLNLLDTNYNLVNGGSFRNYGITDMLFPGLNTITVKAQNCKGSSESSLKLTYQPCDSTLEPVVTIIEPKTSDFVVSNPPRLKGTIIPPNNIGRVQVIISAGPPLYNGFHRFEIYPNEQGVFDYQLQEDDLFKGYQNIIEVFVSSRNGCVGQGSTKIVFDKNDKMKRIKGRVQYEDASSDGQTSTGFKPVRFCRATLQLNYGSGQIYEPILTNSEGYFSFAANADGLKSAAILLGNNEDEYHINSAVRISKDLEYCNEYVWWWSDAKSAFIGHDLNFGNLRIGRDRNLEFKGYWQEHNHDWGACGGPINSLPGGSVYFNVADVILCAKIYATEQRAKASAYDQADDSIGEVAVTWEGSSHYDDFWGEMHLAPGDGFNDAVIVHEYAHYLQGAISTLNSDGRSHSECDATYLEFAWKEGFPEYYANIVPYHYNLSNMGTQGIEDNFCDSPSETVEGTVDAILWDLVDKPGQHFPEPNGAMITKDETFDTLSGKEDIVFSIFDNEMDKANDVDICEFVNKGWLGSRLPLSQQEREAIKPICQHFNIGCVQP
jgi:hypothetical protein